MGISVAEAEERVSFIKKVKEFGEKRIGLNFCGSFETYNPNPKYPYWLYVSDRDGVNNVLKHPYIGSMGNERMMVTMAKSFEVLGYDAYLFTAEAWGGGMCPILPRLIHAPPERQVYVVLHEGWHCTSWNFGRTHPYAFEEAAGIVIGAFGSMLFAKEYGDKNLEHSIERFISSGFGFYDWINASCRAIRDMYMSAAFDSVTEEDKEMMRKSIFARLWKESGQFREWVRPIARAHFSQPINNAFFVRYRNYSTYQKLMREAAIKLSGIDAIMDAFTHIPDKRTSAKKYFENIVSCI
ncbi:MAG: hypothetical protein A2934_04350 [Candidatus Sungbacteria bacterium RIFCSPLOWO2_01_FULL_47_10]|uniref:Uncharacterized protein n=1 Tax=Candidatus Sungbacteria bacterium RIFCSPLOWO2_01_FULL_47_10 TaxID=1802276 RepID=A0A1G2L315_9BACT|nr:MAG: hypothetical protein A2934_04350 [Candidatus Sungbacteria bacterium RIFCSPLOWO2_01_FULL_47_10]